MRNFLATRTKIEQRYETIGVFWQIPEQNEQEMKFVKNR